MKMLKQGDTVNFEGVKGKVYNIVETYRKNILSVKTIDKRRAKGVYVGNSFSLAQTKDGSLELINSNIE